MKTGLCSASILFLLILLPCIAPCAEPEVRYAIQDMGRGVLPKAMNNAGDMAGTIVTSDAGHEAFLYKGGTLTPLGKLGGMGSSAHAINDRADLLATVCIDTACSDVEGRYPVLLKDGRVTDLRSTSAGLRSAQRINNSGQILGRSRALSDYHFGEVQTVVLYGYLDDTTKVIWKPSEGAFPASGVLNNLGEVAYSQSAFPEFEVSVPYLYSSGVSQRLPSYWVANDMNDRGQIVGFDGGFGVFYDKGLTRIQVTALEGFDHVRFVPLAINNEALMVGRADYTPYAATYRNGQLTLLDNSLLVSDDNWVINRVEDVNDRGQIIGYGSKNGEANHGFVMTPVAVTRYPVTLNIDGSGGGSVHGAMSCLSGAPCPPETFDENSLVYLVASPDAFSLFGGWNGDCSITGDICMLTIDGPKGVTATFHATPKVIVGSTEYSLVKNAFAEAPDNAVIRAVAAVFDEAQIVLQRSVRLTLSGGYSAGFTMHSGVTAVEGKLVIRSGTLRIDHVVLR